MIIHFPAQPSERPRCGRGVGRGRKCLSTLVLSAYQVDARGIPISQPEWWCPKHAIRADTNGEAPIQLVAQCGKGTVRTNVSTGNYKYVVL